MKTTTIIAENLFQQLLTCEQIDKYPGEELGKGIHPLGHHGLENVGSDDVHHHVELEGVGEEDGQGQEQEGHLGQEESGESGLGTMILQQVN